MAFIHSANDNNQVGRKKEEKWLARHYNSINTLTFTAFSSHRNRNENSLNVNRDIVTNQTNGEK